MKPIDKQEFEFPQARSKPRELTFFAQLRRLRRAFKWPFQPRYDLTRLNARLCRDAGINECDLERAKFAKSPLIR
jgi:uncharacterized protein YjiS (DUF1127 family)